MSGETTRTIARSPAAVSLAILLFAVLPASAVNLRPADAAPEFALADIDGKTVILSGFRGKTVLIAFWSTWCP